MLRNGNLTAAGYSSVQSQQRPSAAGSMLHPHVPLQPTTAASRGPSTAQVVRSIDELEYRMGATPPSRSQTATTLNLSHQSTSGFSAAAIPRLVVPLGALGGTAAGGTGTPRPMTPSSSERFLANAQRQLEAALREKHDAQRELMEMEGRLQEAAQEAFAWQQRAEALEQLVLAEQQQQRGASHPQQHTRPSGSASFLSGGIASPDPARQPSSGATNRGGREFGNAAAGSASLQPSDDATTALLLQSAQNELVALRERLNALEVDREPIFAACLEAVQCISLARKEMAAANNAAAAIDRDDDRGDQKRDDDDDGSSTQDGHRDDEDEDDDPNAGVVVDASDTLGTMRALLDTVQNLQDALHNALKTHEKAADDFDVLAHEWDDKEERFRRN
jgi:hypothetical protein